MYREQQNKTAASLEEFKTESILKIVIFICLCLTQQRKCKRKQSQNSPVANIVCISSDVACACFETSTVVYSS